MAEYQSRDRAVENAVAQELQSLIVREAMAAVSQCLAQQIGTMECVSDSPAELLIVHGLKFTCNSYPYHLPACSHCRLWPGRSPYFKGASAPAAAVVPANQRQAAAQRAPALFDG